MSSTSWLPVSATEWMASASIEEDELSSQATNLAMAIARLALSAAMIDFVLSSLAIGVPFGRVHLVRAPVR